MHFLKVHQKCIKSASDFWSVFKHFVLTKGKTFRNMPKNIQMALKVE